MATKRISIWSGPNSATFAGGVFGLLVFLVVGLLPSLLYGGYAGVILGSAIFGAPIHESIFAQATVVLGVLSGVLSIGAIFVLAGAIAATGISTLVRATTGAAQPIEVPAEGKAHE